MDRAFDSRTRASLFGRLAADPGGAAAWDEFVRRYGPKVLQWCRRWGLQEADAQDVSQNVLLLVARQVASFRYDPARSFRAWLKTITRRAWCDWLEAQKRPGRGSGDSQVHTLLASVEAGDDLERRVEEEYTRELFEAASARVRLRVELQTWEAFRLTALDGLPGAEAAAKLAMKVGAVFVAKNRVEKMLRETIRELEGDGDDREDDLPAP
jgi:RNA polymerase sigma-70 factor (ECF subfamily)